jgi:hypothetical protein
MPSVDVGLMKSLAKKANQIRVLDNVPVFDWVYGCSPTAAGMLIGYYSLHGYIKLTDGKVCPHTNSQWGTTKYPFGECPFIASHKGYAGRSIFGHVDDYWIDVFSESEDPYVTAGRAAHVDDCIADFTRTSVKAWGQPDGGTSIIYGLDKTIDDISGEIFHRRDFAHGVKLFIESKGYTVTTAYNQAIYNSQYNMGFSYADYKNEIDASRPVIIHAGGHTMLGIGYNDDGNNKIFIHDAWDTLEHYMVWGGVYKDLKHNVVTVIQLNGSGPVSINKFRNKLIKPVTQSN